MHFASLHNQKKDNNKFRNKKQPALPENLTIWGKRRHIHPDWRRGEDRQLGQRRYTARLLLEDWAGKAVAGGSTFACR